MGDSEVRKPRQIFDTRRMKTFCRLFNTFDGGEFRRILLEKDTRLNMVRAKAWEQFTVVYNEQTGDECTKRQLQDLWSRIQKVPENFYWDIRGQRVLRVDGREISGDPAPAPVPPPVRPVTASNLPSAMDLFPLSHVKASLSPPPSFDASCQEGNDIPETARATESSAAPEAEEMALQHLSIRFGIDAGEDVCLIICEPSLSEVVGLLESLVILCHKDAPANLAALAIGSLGAAAAACKPGSAKTVASLIRPKKDNALREDDCPKTEDNDDDEDDGNDGVGGSAGGGSADGGRKRKSKSEADDSDFILKAEFEEEEEDNDEVIQRPKKKGQRIVFRDNNGEGDSGDKPPKKPKKPVRHKGYLSEPASTFLYPEAQEMLDRFAFRKKLVKKGVRNAVCPECRRGGYTEMSLRKHRMTEHNHVACPTCRQLFSKEGLEEHACPLRNLSCDKCPKTFATLDGWKYHQAYTHAGVRKMCHLCGKEMSYVNQLRKHLEIHHGILPPPTGHRGTGVPSLAPPFYPCSQCGKRLKNRPALRTHERRMHGETPYRSRPCRWCGRIFTTIFSLKRHEESVHRSGGGCKKSQQRHENERELWMPGENGGKEEEQEDGHFAGSAERSNYQ